MSYHRWHVIVHCIVHQKSCTLAFIFVYMCTEHRDGHSQEIWWSQSLMSNIYTYIYIHMHIHTSTICISESHSQESEWVYLHNCADEEPYVQHGLRPVYSKDNAKRPGNLPAHDDKIFIGKFPTGQHIIARYEWKVSKCKCNQEDSSSSADRIQPAVFGWWFKSHACKHELRTDQKPIKILK